MKIKQELLRTKNQQSIGELLGLVQTRVQVDASKFDFQSRFNAKLGEIAMICDHFKLVQSFCNNLHKIVLLERHFQVKICMNLRQLALSFERGLKKDVTK